MGGFGDRTAGGRDSLPTYRTRVEKEWLDYNGHMNEAFYLLAFSRATDVLLDAIGIDAGYREEMHCSVYTVETHICYLEEVGFGAPLRVQVRLLGHDAKRLHVWSEMLREDLRTVLSTAEMVMIHVDASIPSAAPFPRETAERVEVLWAAQRHLPWPERAGRSIRPII
jgi:acyl-CoA thioester hydrolase